MDKSLTSHKTACQTVPDTTGGITFHSLGRLEIIVPVRRTALKSYDLISLPETFSISTSAAKPGSTASR